MRNAILLFFYTMVVFIPEFGFAADLTEVQKSNLAKLIKLAEDGKPAAQMNLGTLYYLGQGVEKDYKKAFIWIKKAADQNHSEAQVRLGGLYEKGVGVERSDKEAVFWYQKAAEQGNPLGQFSLGINYFTGLGVAQDRGEAIKWQNKACAGGYKTACGVVDIIEGRKKEGQSILIEECKNKDLPACRILKSMGVGITQAQHESPAGSISKAFKYVIYINIGFILVVVFIASIVVIVKKMNRKSKKEIS